MAEPALFLRPFAPGDQHAARTLILQGLGDRFGFIDETLNPDLDDIAAHYLARGHLFLVALCQQKLVGTGALLIQPDQVGQIVRVSTDHAYRRQGIASSVCLQLISLARQHALSQLIVETTHDWYDAIRLYQKLGFVEYQRVRQGVYLARDLI
jgi:ribosomal protein S18 acetylase RimI-like enzyme